jgi:hypothetical protein
MRWEEMMLGNAVSDKIDQEIDHTTCHEPSCRAADSTYMDVRV